MKPLGYVVWLADGECEFPHFIFSADTDMVTNGLVSFTARDSRELYLVRLLPEEMSAGESGVARAATRVMATARRRDLVPILAHFPAPARTRTASFAQFRERYHAPAARYSTLSGRGEAHLVREESTEAFIAGGGIVHVLES